MIGARTLRGAVAISTPSTSLHTAPSSCGDLSDRLAINASYWHYDADFSGGFYATEDLDVSRTVKYPSHLRYGLGGVTATYDLDSVSVLYSIAYNTLANPQVSPFPRNRMEQGLDVRTTSQELRFSSSGPATLEWTAGLFDRDAYRADSLYVQSSGYRILVGAHARSQALFGEATYRLPSIPVRLSAGARVVREVLDDDQMNSNDMLLVTQNTTYHSVDPRFSIAWDPSNDLRLYTSAAKGYRSGQTQLRTSLELAKTPRNRRARHPSGRLGLDLRARRQGEIRRTSFRRGRGLPQPVEPPCGSRAPWPDGGRCRGQLARHANQRR
ncbi:MAG: TonB-dependent receptor [Gammaproteobacteria bacterium]